MMLDANLHAFLLHLERAHLNGQDWVPVYDVIETIPFGCQQEAVQRGYVEAKGDYKDRSYRIAPAGYTALGDNADHMMRELRADRAAAPFDEMAASLSVVPRQRKGRGSAICSVEGCAEPKHKGGKCHQHYLEAQRVYQARWQEKKRRASRIAATLAADEPPVAEDDTERDIQPPVEDSTPLSVYGEGLGEGCETPPPFAKALAIFILAILTTYYKMKGVR